MSHHKNVHLTPSQAKHLRRLLHKEFCGNEESRTQENRCADQAVATADDDPGQPVCPDCG